MKILYKFATRSRPQKFFQCLDNICQQQNDKENYQIICSADNDDPTMNCDEVMMRARKINNPRIHLNFGVSKNKIAAYNRDMDVAEPDWQILINMSDDMVFTMPGYDDIIRQDMLAIFPDTDGFLHYNDGNQKDNVCTMTIIGRKYFERTGYLYNPTYDSVWCDVESTEVAYMLGKYKYMGDSRILFKHYHPAWGHGTMDDLYRKSENLDTWAKDLQNILNRKKNNYYLKEEEILHPQKHGEQEMKRWISELNNTRIGRGMDKIQFVC